MYVFSSLKGRWFWISVVWAVLIFIGSVIPSSELPSVSLWEADKIVHIIFYFVLTYSLGRHCLQTANAVHIKNILIECSIIAVSYSILIEIIQGPLLPTRSFDVYDIIANFGGTILAVIFLTVFKKRLM